MVKFLTSVCLVVMISSQALAQGAPTSSERRAFSGPRKQLATIVFSGLGGAIVGLSTLSFYGRPQDKLSNIAIGAAFGVIAGTVFVTYRAAANPNQFYGTKPMSEQELQFNRMQAANTSVPAHLQYTFEF